MVFGFGDLSVFAFFWASSPIVFELVAFVSHTSKRLMIGMG